MKKLLLNTLLLFVASIFSSTTIVGQIMPPLKNSVFVYPSNPTVMDSIYVACSYISNDGCPDFTLVKDSVVDNRIFISKKTVDNSNLICTAAFTNFVTKLNLGLLVENTEIYFEGVLIKTINFDCIKDKIGLVVAYKDSSTIVKDSLTGDIYAINDAQLAIGTKIRFKGTKIQCITTPCYNIVNCYEVIENPVCVMDKTGMVVPGVDGCTGQIFIQEYSPISSSRQLYIIKGDVVTSDGTISIGLKVGDKVKFGGYLTKNDSSTSILCRTVGVATCYEVISTPPLCIMDKEGSVIAYKDSLSLIKETLTSDIYAIKYEKLPIETKIRFKGTKIQCITTPCYNIVDCYEVISTPPCVMDKVGTVIAGIDGCTGQFFIQEYSSDNSKSQFYRIENGNIFKSDGTTSFGLKEGDKVKFGGYLIKNDSSQMNLCHLDGVATCYELISTPPGCVMDKVGEVVAGIDNCAGQLFIEDTSYIGMNMIRQLYLIKDSSSNAAITLELKKGDILFMYTDGVNEAMNSSDEEYGTERLQSDLNVMAGANPKEIIDFISGKVTSHANGAVQSDDITMLSLKFQG